jgi:POT family proton-dependent oligopeptide transporter
MLNIFGPLGGSAVLAHLWFYTGFVYFTPLIGGIIADHGSVSIAILIGASMAIGHFMMAFELFLFALSHHSSSNGCFNLTCRRRSADLAPGDHRRDRAYSIFYVGINIGAFLPHSWRGRSARSSAGTTASAPPASA